MIEYGRVQLSLKGLEEQYENHQHRRPGLSELDREGISESVIQRVGTRYDCLWKVLERYLTEELGVAEAPNSPQPIFRLAHENALLAASLDQSLRYAGARIDLAHDYDGEKSQSCLALVPDLIDDAIGPYLT